MCGDSDNRPNRRARRLAAIFIALSVLPLCLPAISPRIPDADHSDPRRVFLEQADVMHRAPTDSFIIISGNVKFRRGGMDMYCDSAHYFLNSESMAAFGNVRMEQGDTLFIYADEMQYLSYEHCAYLYSDPGNLVRMINRDVELTTPSFAYDLDLDVGFYTETGLLKDTSNELFSIQGEYSPTTKEAFFTNSVLLKSLTKPDSITTDTLLYNTDTKIARLFNNSVVYNEQGTIYTDLGTYNTETNIADLYNRSLVVMKSDGTTLQGDTLFYDRNNGYGCAWGNIEINDTVHSAILTGMYGYYNEVVDSAFVTGHALMREYSQGDTLYLHARDIYSLARTDTLRFEADTIAGIEAYERVDTTHVMIAHPRVRFYRSDMQGVCDSMRFEQRDSTLYMLRHPIVWSEEKQIYGNVINLHLNDSTIDRATLPDFGFSAEHIEGEFFNQLSGKEMIAYFTGGEMRRLDVNGNVEAIMLPMENDSTYNKIINMESSFLTADFENQDLLRLKTWPETSGTVTPLYLARRSLFKLSRFRWFEGIRPESPEDVFNITPEMEELMSDSPIPPPPPTMSFPPTLSP